tara:strand:+ start:315 stop:689 length:375 start_codon:yes stop_codon:yes gene_type:complete
MKIHKLLAMVLCLGVLNANAGHNALSLGSDDEQNQVSASSFESVDAEESGSYAHYYYLGGSALVTVSLALLYKQMIAQSIEDPASSLSTSSLAAFNTFIEMLREATEEAMKRNPSPDIDPALFV